MGICRTIYFSESTCYNVSFSTGALPIIEIKHLVGYQLKIFSATELFEILRMFLDITFPFDETICIISGRICPHFSNKTLCCSGNTAMTSV